MQVMIRLLSVLMLSVIALTFVPVQTFAAPPQGTPETYIVQSGDTLFIIAQRYHTTVAAIKQINGIGSSDLIQIGQKLLIPTGDNTPFPIALTFTPNSSPYIVQPSDTLYGIALRYGTTLGALEQLNELSNPSLISIGQALAIPKNATVAKPGLVIDPPSARQGGTVMIQVARPNLASVSGTFNGKGLPFTQSAGYFYALVGISRCAKVGSASLAITTADIDNESSTETVNVPITSTAFIVQAITLPPGKGDLLDPNLIKREEAQLAAIVSKSTLSRMWNGVWRQPLYTTTSSQFGTRRSYNGGPVGACGHEGTDFSTDAGTPIYAPARGQVVFAGLTQVRGNMTVIDHGIGVFSAYYHQSAIDVQVGQVVDPGTLIGKVGTTGLSTGPHLHWSVFVHGEYVDPLEWTRRMFPY